MCLFNLLLNVPKQHFVLLKKCTAGCAMCAKDIEYRAAQPHNDASNMTIKQLVSLSALFHCRPSPLAASPRSTSYLEPPKSQVGQCADVLLRIINNRRNVYGSRDNAWIYNQREI